MVVDSGPAKIAASLWMSLLVCPSCRDLPKARRRSGPTRPKADACMVSFSEAVGSREHLVFTATLV